MGEGGGKGGKGGMGGDIQMIARYASATWNLPNMMLSIVWHISLQKCQVGKKWEMATAFPYHVHV